MFITAASLDFLVSSFAKVQGIVSSIYLFNLEINLQIVSNALENSNKYIYFSTSLIVSSNIALIRSSISSEVDEATTTPLKYFLYIPNVLFNKFPKSLAKSEFNLPTIPFVE